MNVSECTVAMSVLAATSNPHASVESLFVVL